MVVVGLGYNFQLLLTSLMAQIDQLSLKMFTFRIQLDKHRFLIQFKVRLALLFTSSSALKRAPPLPPLTTIPVLSLSVRRAAIQPFPKPRLQHPFVTSYPTTYSLVCGAFTSPDFSNACSSMGRASRCSKTPSMARCSNNSRC